VKEMYKKILCILFIFLYPTICFSEVRNIEFEWEYDGTLNYNVNGKDVKVAGYKLYKDGELFLTTKTPTVYRVTDNVDINPENVCFTMKSYANTGDESTFSLPYCVNAPPMTPDNFAVTVE
jgi:hypothetical protein